MKFLLKPEYIYRPQQIFFRIFRNIFNPAIKINHVLLPWGLQIRINIEELIGKSIWHLGVYELIVCEAIWRLLDEGDIGVDAGANIGQMTGLMSLRVGNSGDVIAFEPHPEVYNELKYNIDIISNNRSLSKVKIYNTAVSKEKSKAILLSPSIFNNNKGVAYIVNNTQGNEGDYFHVDTCRLDDILLEYPAISLLKLDVEMHELSALKGAKRLLSKSEIKNIIYEDYPRLNTKVHEYLYQYGYSIFVLVKDLHGPKIVKLEDYYSGGLNYQSPNYIATIEQEKLMDKFNQKGWRCLAS